VKWRRARIISPVEFVEDRYNHSTRLLLSIIMVLSMMYWPGHHLASVAKISAPALFPNTPWSIDALILFFGAFVLVYTVAGGIWAVSITDVLQFLVLFSVCSVVIVAIFFSGELGTPLQFFRSIPPIEFEHAVRGNTVYTHWYIIGFVASGIFGNVVGDKAQRFFIVRDEKAVRKTAWIAFILFMTSPILFGIAPLAGKLLWPEIGQLAAMTGISKPDESIFIAVVMRYMPAGVVGLFLAAMIAASMSALDSVWNTVSAIVSVDLYKGYFRPSASDREILWVGRITVILLCLAAVTMALFIVHSQLGIFTISNMVLGLIVIPATVPLMVGVVTRRPTTSSAIASIVSGVAIAAFIRFELNWSLGPQYLAVISVCLAPLLTSEWLGRLYRASKILGVSAVFGIGALIWFLLSLVSAPTMVPGVYRNGADSPWLFAALIPFILNNLLLLPSYARDIARSPERMIRFFEKLKKPVDIATELADITVDAKPSAIIGWAALAMGMVPLLLLIFSGGQNWSIYISLSLILFLIAFLFWMASRRSASIE
jgi:Na+/proline symporter